MPVGLKVWRRNADHRRNGCLARESQADPEGSHGLVSISGQIGDRAIGHVMCVVGYDDQVGYDVNNDGKITNDIDINNVARSPLPTMNAGHLSLPIAGVRTGPMKARLMFFIAV